MAARLSSMENAALAVFQHGADKCVVVGNAALRLLLSDEGFQVTALEGFGESQSDHFIPTIWTFLRVQRK